VKKAILISLLAVQLLSSTELFELVKLPVLVHHFLEHKEENNSITFADFIYLHYAKSGGINTDDDDTKLPFKSHEGCPNATVIAVIPAYYSFKAKHEFTETKSFFITDEDFINGTLLSGIWQPPKFC